MEITDEIRGYFEAFARNDDGRDAMFDFAAEGSPAAHYATYWSTVWEAAGPARSYSQDLIFEPGQIDACVPEDQANTTETGCVTYTDFVIDSSTGLLVDFDEFGAPMSDSVALGDGTTSTADGITIEIVVAKQIDAERISIVWTTSNDNDTVSEGQVRAMAVDGAIVQPDAWTQNEVPANGSTLNALNVSLDQLSGTLQYRIVETGSVLEVPVPTP